MQMNNFSAPYLATRDLAVARQYMDQGEFSPAAWIARWALEAQPMDTAAWGVLAQATAAMGHDQAAQAFQARAANPGQALPTQPASRPAARIFVGGTGRSGTSLLRRVLSTHPQIAGVNDETKCISDQIFRLAPYWFHAAPPAQRGQALATLKDLWRQRFYCYKTGKKANPTDDRSRGFCKWLDPAVLEEALPGLDALMEAATLQEVEAVWGDFYAGLFLHRAQERGLGAWVEKTPNNAMYSRFLQAWMPDARLINIVRDGRDVACSMANVAWGQKDNLKALDWWANNLTATMRALETLPPPWRLTIRYEDLVTQPGPVLGQVAAFLGMEPAFDMEVFASSVGRWKKSMPVEVQQYALTRYKPLFKFFGYETDLHQNEAAPQPEQAEGNFEMKKKNDGLRYVQDLLAPLMAKLACVPMTEFTTRAEPRFALRHDVDANIAASIQMAALEAHNGLTATYFLRPPSPYFAPDTYYGRFEGKRLVRNPQLIEWARYFLDKGHQVGLHNNIAELAAFMGKSLHEVMDDEVRFFREHGIELTGTAGHGSRFFKDLDFVSYEIFREAKVKPGCERGRMVGVNGFRFQLHQLSLADYGFQYEAYSLPYDLYLSDSDKKWDGSVVSRSSHPELTDYPPEKFLPAMTRVMEEAADKAGSIQILIHPQHWMIG